MNKIEEKLKNQGIKYEIREYSKACKNALEASREIGFPHERMFKSLLCKQDGKYIMLLIPSPSKVNFIKLNKQMNSDVVFADIDEIEKVTGYKLGTVSPIGINPQIDIFIDRSCHNYEQIGIGCGEYGKELLISPSELIEITNAKVLDLT